MSLTELQDAILVRLIGKPVETEVVCKYPGWLEKRMAQHRAWVKSHFRSAEQWTKPMKDLTHAQFYAEYTDGEQDGKDAKGHQRVSAQTAGG